VWSVEEKQCIEDPADSSQTLWERLGKGTLKQFDMSADFETAAFDMLYFDQGGVQGYWAGVDKRVATMVIQGSLDGQNWRDLPLTALSVDTDPGGNALWDLSDIGVRYCRVRYTAGSTATGTINFRYVFKSRR
jgi:hypothetical protein